MLQHASQSCGTWDHTGSLPSGFLQPRCPEPALRDVLFPGQGLAEQGTGLAAECWGH